jgi:hypothetical protein
MEWSVCKRFAPLQDLRDKRMLSPQNPVFHTAGNHNRAEAILPAALSNGMTVPLKVYNILFPNSNVSSLKGCRETGESDPSRKRGTITVILNTFKPDFVLNNRGIS